MPTLIIEVRLETRALMEELYALAIAEARNQGWLKDSWLGRHVCSHDEAVLQPCEHELVEVA